MTYKPKVKEISETLFEVLSHSVKIQKKMGRTLLLCDCRNHTKFCLENPWCIHKQLVIEHMVKKPIINIISDMISSYEKYQDLNMEFRANVFIDDLNKIKEVLK